MFPDGIRWPLIYPFPSSMQSNLHCTALFCTGRGGNAEGTCKYGFSANGLHFFQSALSLSLFHCDMRRIYFANSPHCPMTMTYDDDDMDALESCAIHKVQGSQTYPSLQLPARLQSIFKHIYRKCAFDAPCPLLHLLSSTALHLTVWPINRPCNYTPCAINSGSRERTEGF